MSGSFREKRWRFVLFRLRGKGISYWISTALGLLNKKWRRRKEKFWHVGWIYN